jgi:hypothetical protein
MAEPNVIDSPARPNRKPGASRASVRGVYADREGKERIVGAGDVIPRGWTHVRDADNFGARAAAPPSARARAGGGGGRRGGGKAKPKPDEDKSVPGPDENKAPTKAELEARAAELDIEGRSSMNKDELALAIAAAEEGQ